MTVSIIVFGVPYFPMLSARFILDRAILFSFIADFVEIDLLCRGL